MGRGKLRSSRDLPKPIDPKGRKTIGFGLWLMGFAKRLNPSYRIFSGRLSAKKFHPRLPEPDRICWRHRDRPVDAENGDLELVAGFDGRSEHHAVWNVVALDCGRGRIASLPRHITVHPHFRIIVDKDVDHRARR